MVAYMTEFTSKQKKTLVERVYRFRDEPVESMREVALTSADDIKSLKAPVRLIAHSGVKLAAVSQNAMQSLIELESEVITSAMTAAALRLERAAHAESIVDLVLDQAELLGASRDRLVDEATRAVEIFKVAGRDARKVAVHLYEKVLEKADEDLPKVTSTRVRKAKRVVRKSTARVRKVAA